MSNADNEEFPMSIEKQELRAQLLMKDEAKNQYEKELTEIKSILQQFPGRGIDEEGFPLPEYPHMEIAQHKYRVGQLLTLIEDLEKEIDNLMPIFFAMD